MVDIDLSYTPGQDAPEHGISSYRTPPAHARHAKKIIHDLARMARLVNGKFARIYRPAKGSRCSTCTDSMTGQVLMANCPQCLGTGFTAAFTQLGDGYWVVPEFGAIRTAATEFGNVQTPASGRDAFALYAVPEVYDRDVITMVDEKLVFRIDDVGPQISAIQGVIVGQLVQCSRIPQGGIEYNLVDW